MTDAYGVLDNRDQETANDRFKRLSRVWFWGGMIAATGAHFALFALFPQLTAADVSWDPRDLEAIDLPPSIEIPPPPPALARPATPIVSDVLIDEDITIAQTDFESNPVAEIGPPEQPSQQDLSDQPAFTPYTVGPTIVNVNEVRQALERAYPRTLRDAGIGGAVRVWFFIDTAGVVRNARVVEDSGLESLDQAALDVARVYRFTPARNMDSKVPVWVQQLIRFEAR